MELSLGAESAQLLDPEDLTSFAVVLEGDEEPGPEALAVGGTVGFRRLRHRLTVTEARRRTRALPHSVPIRSPHTRSLRAQSGY